MTIKKKAEPVTNVDICERCLTPKKSNRSKPYCPLCDADPLLDNVKDDPNTKPLNAFALLMDACGLNYRETAEVLKCSKASVGQWQAGTRKAPLDVIEKLQETYLKVEEAARYGRPAKGILRKGIARRSMELRILLKKGE